MKGADRQAKTTLGTVLRHLIELLDGDVEAAYRQAGLDYRPRYTPLVRALEELGEASIRTLSIRTGLSHSAVSQSVTQMLKDDLVLSETGADARERIIKLSPTAEALLPILHEHWWATARAAEDLINEIGIRLDHAAGKAILALQIDRS